MRLTAVQLIQLFSLINLKSWVSFDVLYILAFFACSICGHNAEMLGKNPCIIFFFDSVLRPFQAFSLISR